MQVDARVCRLGIQHLSVDGEPTVVASLWLSADGHNGSSVLQNGGNNDLCAVGRHGERIFRALNVLSRHGAAGEDDMPALHFLIAVLLTAQCHLSSGKELAVERAF